MTQNFYLSSPYAKKRPSKYAKKIVLKENVTSDDLMKVAVKHKPKPPKKDDKESD